MPELAATFDGKKFMWDKGNYSTEAEADKKKREYEKDGFETRLVEEEGKYFVYSRRVVTEIVLEGEPPPG
jgi:hypothetical protein